MSELKKINLGCGNYYFDDWINVDFFKTGEDVVAHNLLNGIPFGDNEFNVVYHSHLLEHFSKQKAGEFIKECFRVLKPEGIIRIAVPDLEIITKLYLENLEKAYNGDVNAEKNYDWMMIEMYDQSIRNESGGEMFKYFKQEKIKNFEFVEQRLGNEALELKRCASDELKQECHNKKKTKFKKIIKDLFKSKKRKLIEEENLKYMEIGKFRLSGEIHQWMYDRFSLKRLLIKNGFININIKTAFESDIPDWEQFNLDIHQGKIRKPDSFYIEAKKAI